jgi:hypothetical protein
MMGLPRAEVSKLICKRSDSKYFRLHRPQMVPVAYYFSLNNSLKPILSHQIIQKFVVGLQLEPTPVFFCDGFFSK